MEKRSMELLVDAGNSLGIDLDGREDYSGRSMYGKSTHAIVADDLAHIIAAAAMAGAGLATASGRGEDFGINEFVDDLHGLRMDSMGRRIVVY